MIKKESKKKDLADVDSADMPWRSASLFRGLVRDSSREFK